MGAEGNVGGQTVGRMAGLLGELLEGRWGRAPVLRGGRWGGLGLTWVADGARCVGSMGLGARLGDHSSNAGVSRKNGIAS